MPLTCLSCGRVICSPWNGFFECTPCAEAAQLRELQREAAQLALESKKREKFSRLISKRVKAAQRRVRTRHPDLLGELEVQHAFEKAQHAVPMYSTTFGLREDKLTVFQLTRRFR